MDMQFWWRRAWQNTRAVIFSSAKDIPIVCKEQHRIDSLLQIAKELWLDIPPPLLAKDINWGKREVIIDDNLNTK